MFGMTDDQVVMTGGIERHELMEYRVVNVGLLGLAYHDRHSCDYCLRYCLG